MKIVDMFNVEGICRVCKKETMVSFKASKCNECCNKQRRVSYRKRMEDPEYHEKLNKQSNDYHKKRMKDDSEYHDNRKDYDQRYRELPEARKKKKDYDHQRYIKNKQSKTKRILFNLLNIWSTKIWPYATAGKLDVCDMIMTELDIKGYNDLNFLSLPGNGREIHELIANGFDINYAESLGVDKNNIKALKEYFLKLFNKGDLKGILPIVRANIDELVVNNEDLPEFNAIHLDYNGVLTHQHILATEAALLNNPDAIVAVTVQRHDRFKQAVKYTFGDFPFINIKPEALFYQPYKGRRGVAMETYCFQNS